MILFAVEGPTPGRSSSSLREAVFRSTSLPVDEGGALPALRVSAAPDPLAGGADGAAGSRFGGEEDAEETVTCFSIFEIVFSGTPAFARSDTDR